MSDFIKKPCAQCPFRRDVTPFLHPERAAEIADAASNPYDNFACHKTLEYLDECDQDGEDLVSWERAKTCAGFLTIRAQMLSEDCMPAGFNPSYDKCYSDADEMVDEYQYEWRKTNQQ